MSISNQKKKSLLGSFGVVSLATAASRVFGLAREQVMAYFFGAGMATDAFLTAFRVPNLLRDMFAEGALSSAFVPVFKDKMVVQSNEEAFKLADVVITALLVVVGGIVLLGIIASPAIIYITANGFTQEAEKFHLTVQLTRIMFAYLLLVSLSALVMGMLNSFDKFGIPAISPALFNLGIMASVFALYKFLDAPVYALAIGVLVGGLGQLFIQVPLLWKIGYHYKPTFDVFNKGLRRVVKLLTPMIIGLSAGRINILVNTLLASYQKEGAISFLSYSYRLMHFPLGIFAVALGTVALPRVSEMVAIKNHDGLGKTFDDTISFNLFVIVPSAAFLALMGREIVDLIYAWGRFSQADAVDTSLALLHYSYGLIGFAAVRVTVPFYYGCGDAKLPMRASVISVVANILLYYPSIKLLGFAGLAAASSVAALLNFGILLYFLPARGVKYSLGKLSLNVFRIFLAAGLAFYVAKLIPFTIYHGNRELLVRLDRLLLPLAMAGILYFAFCAVLRVNEINKLIRRVFR